MKNINPNIPDNNNKLLDSKMKYETNKQNTVANNNKSQGSHMKYEANKQIAIKYKTINH